jgi:hypothetical protein
MSAPIVIDQALRASADTGAPVTVASTRLAGLLRRMAG